MFIHLFIGISSVTINDNDEFPFYNVKLTFSSELLKNKAINFLENKFISIEVRI
jgi:hypothetical protein